MNHLTSISNKTEFQQFILPVYLKCLDCKVDKIIEAALRGSKSVFTMLDVQLNR